MELMTVTAAVTTVVALFCIVRLVFAYFEVRDLRDRLIMEREVTFVVLTDIAKGEATVWLDEDGNPVACRYEAKETTNDEG